ncbi:hypothetical protein EAG_11933 [Camponotus floridanus]|uniref:Uncharacterized protein n=1 Tax=Camponotus floridanus TaxID=104421 RepID=E2A8J4_CAMFO|nr:hypothetical protein EAG_11933 [Camponotus floridanus]
MQSCEPELLRSNLILLAFDDENRIFMLYYFEQKLFRKSRIFQQFIPAPASGSLEEQQHQFAENCRIFHGNHQGCSSSLTTILIPSTIQRKPPTYPAGFLVKRQFDGAEEIRATSPKFVHKTGRDEKREREGKKLKLRRKACIAADGVTILLSQTVFSLLVAHVLTRTSEAVPLIGTDPPTYPDEAKLDAVGSQPTTNVKNNLQQEIKKSRILLRFHILVNLTLKSLRKRLFTVECIFNNDKLSSNSIVCYYVMNLNESKNQIFSIRSWVIGIIGSRDAQKTNRASATYASDAEYIFPSVKTLPGHNPADCSEGWGMKFKSEYFSIILLSPTDNFDYRCPVLAIYSFATSFSRFYPPKCNTEMRKTHKKYLENAL